MRPWTSPAERFFAKVQKTPTCWVWIGAKSGTGYGNFRLDGQVWRAHRVSYTNRACVNPDHLEPVTRRENTLRGVSPFITVHLTGVCRRGHEGAYVQTASGRRCRECQQLNRDKHRAAKNSRRREQRVGLTQAGVDAMRGDAS